MAVAALVLGLASAGNRQDVELSTPGGSDGFGFGVSLSTTAAGRPYSIGSIPICVAAPANVRLLGVAFRSTTPNLRLDRYALHRIPDAWETVLSAGQTTLTRAGSVGRSDGRVTAVCAPDHPGTGPYDELGLQFTRTSSAPAGGSELEVAYAGPDGQRRVLPIALTFWLCPNTPSLYGNAC